MQTAARPAAATQTGWAADPNSFDLNAADPRFLDDPFPTYRRLRQEAPYHRNPDGTFFVTRYADVVFVLRDKRMSNDKARDFMRKFGPTPIYEHHTHTMVFRPARP